MPGTGRRAGFIRLAATIVAGCSIVASNPASAETVVVKLPLPQRQAPAPGKNSAQRLAPVEIRQAAKSIERAPAAHGSPTEIQDSVPQSGGVEGDALQRATLTVTDGSSLYTMFSTQGYSHGDLMEILDSDSKVKRRLSRLRPGDVITIFSDEQNRIHRLSVGAGSEGPVAVARTEDGFAAAPTTTNTNGSIASPVPVQLTTAAIAPAADATQPGIGDEPEERRSSPRASSPISSVSLTLGKGQSLYELFKVEKLSRIDLLAMVKADKASKRRLSRLRPGQVIHVDHISGDIEVLRLQGRRGNKDFVVTRSEQGYRGREEESSGKEFITAAKRTQSDAIKATISPGKQRPALQGLPREVASTITPEQPQTDSKTDEATPATTYPATVVEHELTVQPGDSLYAVLNRLQVPANELARIMAIDSAKPLKRLQPGQVLSVMLLPDKRIQSLRTELDDTRTLKVQRTENGSMRVRLKERPLERRTKSVAGIIEDSLFLSGQRAGVSDRLLMQLVGIFGWDVDFALDVRVGDRFSIVFEELYKDGVKIRDGKILAAGFVNRGRQLRGIRYTDGKGATAYFSPEGMSMRKAFLRTPVDFSRISSRFSGARRHPVLNRTRAHKGVDYAAPRGTPVRAAGNGRVTFAGRKRGYGRTVVLQHGAKYSTLYAHMNRLHRRSKKGLRVRQGEIIGYVGSTGVATGPHLHYEFRVNGVHKDPLRVTLPKALPIERKYRQDFLNVARPLIAELDLLEKTSLATSD